MNQVQRNGHLLGFPPLSAASSEDDSSEPGEEQAPGSPSVKPLSTSPERQKVGPFTEREDRLLRVFGRKMGYPPTLGMKAWEEFSERVRFPHQYWGTVRLPIPAPIKEQMGLA